MSYTELYATLMFSRACQPPVAEEACLRIRFAMTPFVTDTQVSPRDIYETRLEHTNRTWRMQ